MLAAHTTTALSMYLLNTKESVKPVIGVPSKIIMSKCGSTALINVFTLLESNSSLGFGGTIPLGIKDKFLIPVFLIYFC